MKYEVNNSIWEEIKNMIFQDFQYTGALYHIVSILDLEKALKEGLKYDDKSTYEAKYYDFHCYFDDNRIEIIPYWVERKKAIFSSMNFKEHHKWHSHTALLKVKADISKCWVCNENRANLLYEPFILKNIAGFDKAQHYLNIYGKGLVEAYWKDSLSMVENIKLRRDLEEGFDEEVLIFEDIPPENIECVYIFSDHKIMTVSQWDEFFTEAVYKPIGNILR